jgi:hypothetical protein
MYYLDFWKPIFEIAFYFTGIVIAIIGLKLWYRELKGKAHFQTAKNVLVSTYKVRDAITICQNMFLYGYEYADRPKGNSETESEKSFYDSYYAFNNRFNKVYEERSILYNSYVEAEAYFNKDAINSIDKLFKVIHQLKVAIDLYHQFNLKNVSDTKTIEQYFNIMYGVTNYGKDKSEQKDYYDDNNFAMNLNQAIVEIEKYFKKLIK